MKIRTAAIDCLGFRLDPGVGQAVRQITAKINCTLEVAFTSDEAAANPGDMQLKFDDNAHARTGTRGAGLGPNNIVHRAAAETTVG